jgi:cupin superfamily acireductone dioxygenase involved in methionine salvage
LGRQLTPDSLPDGLEYGPQGLIARGVVARRIPHHPVLPRPNRAFPTCILDELAGQSMLGMHLAEMGPGAIKCDHRHLDETLVYIVAGSGFCDYRQADDAPLQRVPWGTGDLLVVPTNAYHRHETGSDGAARQLTFRNIKAMNALLHGSRSMYDKVGGLYDQSAARFTNRYADEPDYWTTRELQAPGRVRTNVIREVPNEQLLPSGESFGRGVSMTSYDMGGQRTLDVAIVGIDAGGHIAAHRSATEEALFIVAGSGSSEFWTEDGRTFSVSWSAGDLLAPPLGMWRRHEGSHDSGARMLRIRNVTLHRALGLEPPALNDSWAPAVDRFPDLIEPIW